MAVVGGRLASVKPLDDQSAKSLGKSVGDSARYRSGSRTRAGRMKVGNALTVMRRPVLLAVSAIALLFALLNFNRAVEVIRLEGADGAVQHIITGGGDTVYAAGFSDDRFLKISSGMSDGEVVESLGEPLDRYYPQAIDGVQPWTSGMRWSRSANDSHYSVRAVLFNEGRVVRRISEYYVD